MFMAKRAQERVFVNDETINYENLEDKHHYSDGELKEIAGKLDISDINSVDEHVFLIDAKKDQDGLSFELHTKQIDGVKKRFKAVASSPSPSQTDEFKKVKMDKSASLERVFQGLSNEEVQEVQDSAKRIFRNFIKIHKNNKREFSLFDSEAADHGFVYGALALNFKYRYGLNCYVERAGGSGRADLIFMSCTKDANGIINPKPIPVVIEFKGYGHTALEAIKQIKGKGYLYNLSMRTKAENAVIVGASFASNDDLQVEQDVIFQSQGFVQQLLKRVKKFNENDVSGIQNNLKEELENLYHVIPSHGRHYLSKVILGQVLAEKAGGLNKRIFTYEDRDKSIGKEATTFVLFNGDKAVILNIIEHAGGQRQTKRQKRLDDKQIPPIGKLRIDSVVKVDVEINTGVKNPVVAFEVEGDESKSYYHVIKIEKVSDINSKDKYHGKFQKIKEVEVDKIVKGLEELTDFKDKFQWIKEADSKLKELLSPLKEALFAHEELIKNEADFRAILQGLFMNKKGEDDEEVKVYAESSIPSKGRIDLALSCAIPKSDGSFEESCPIIIELKYAHGKKQVETRLEEAKKRLDKKYNLVKSFTNKRTAKFLVMVFDEKAENADELIVASTRDFIVEHTSQSETDSQTVVDSPPLDFGVFPLSEGSLNSEHTASPSDGKQRLDEFDFQEDSSSLDNLSLVPQVGSSDRNRELDEFDFQENSLLSQRRKRKRSPEPYREQERSVKSDLDDVSVQSHLTRAKDLGLG
ncbi:phosphocholine transferase AnkX [Trichonephila clavata]|uniref:Phosphocholine transferase AnkX n=1 Tax=Trichonephila clavata TaxID=2740835 RepID=A0A8X6J7Z7_TRICU|nr:phosphocholine transferase AnkX [Trichonephila clavata]